MTTWDFNEKIIAIQRGDKEAMKGIYDEYYAFIYYTALSYLKNNAMAEDVASDVLIALFTKHDTQTYVKNPKTYLYVLTINECKNLTKFNQKNDNQFEFGMVADCDSQTDFGSVEINQLLIKLPDMERNILIMHILWGFSFVEIAKRLNLSLSTVKRKYKFARDCLAQSLTK